jgi:phosphonate degradation associated HDIG domain protein
MTPMEAADKAFGLFEEFGSADYIGEAISQLEHASQSAQCAIDEGFDDEVVLAAFFHDIGHLCQVGNHAVQMDGFGVMEHEKLGAAFLGSLGFSERLTALVQSHVQAKRYLCAVKPEYLASLSEASLKTLGFQGGPMNDEEVALFEASPWFSESIRMRYWDEAAKETGIPIIDLVDLKARAIRLLS